MEPKAKIVLEFKDMTLTLTLNEAKQLYNILEGLVGEKTEQHTHIHNHDYWRWQGPYTYPSTSPFWYTTGTSWVSNEDPNTFKITYLGDTAQVTNT